MTAAKTEVRPSAKPPESRPKRLHRTGDEGGGDEFYVPKRLIPRGYSVEWKRVSTINKEEDDSYFVGLADQGWEPATTDQFPTLVSKNYKGKSIIRKGMMLMIRPVELTEEARQEDIAAAREQVESKLQALGETPKGELTRKVQSLKRSYERPPIEDDEA